MQDKKTIEQFPPQKLLSAFLQGRLGRCLLLALALHVLLIGGTSIGYLLSAMSPPVAEEPDVSPEQAPAPEKDPVATTEEEMIKQHKKTPIVQKITEQATPEELPRVPDGLGISLEDTNWERP